MKEPADLTIKEMRHLINVVPFDEREFWEAEKLLGEIEAVATKGLDYLKVYRPDHKHTCPQCAEPPKEKSKKVHFSLD